VDDAEHHYAPVVVIVDGDEKTLTGVEVGAPQVSVGVVSGVGFRVGREPPEPLIERARMARSRARYWSWA
jgi:hypothetical protein